MDDRDYRKCADRIADALKLEAGERVLLKVDPRCFAPLEEPLRALIRAAGAQIHGVIRADADDRDLQSFRELFSAADVFIWLPELHQGNGPPLARALVEWLDSKRGRSVHFHWQSGSYPVGFLPLPPQGVIDRMYLAALDVKPADLERKHRRAIELLRSGPIRVTTPEGTDMTFTAGERPFSSQIGDASRQRMSSARIRIDLDVELPAGVLRVAPIESSANGTIALPVWRPLRTEGRNLLLRFVDGRVAIQGVQADSISEELSAAGGDARMFREFAVGFNSALKVPRECPFIAYYGYGAGVVRLSLGDNEEMGGANRGGGVYWNFLHNATVTAGSRCLVKDGALTAEADT